ncbi:NlpC/P60 family protein [Amycolatopsis tucumanensis]|uniref:NlpC/P60 family protein n=2 Tax=Amycolatopsis tucumanensis TaxID=401106 RepID=A0ABP7JX62_9PSEU
MRPHNRRLTNAVRALAATAVLAMTLVAIPAGAQPSEGSDEMQRYQELGAAAAQADEDLLGAQADLTNANNIRDRANADLAAANEALARAQAAEGQFRGTVDEFTAESFRGGQFARLSAIMGSSSAQDYLDRMSALSMLSANNMEALTQLQAASSQAATAQAAAAEAKTRADAAAAEAQRALDLVNQRRRDLNTQIRQVRQALNALSASEREVLNTVQDTGSYLGPPGAANDALQAALSKRGSEYEWGATGPSEFDCSGLTSWAYKQAGVSLPRTSRQQYTVGRPVSMSELQPGDLVFFDDGSGDPSKIHHVGMYVGSGKMVDAPTEGQLVDVRSAKGDGHYIGARRIVG